MKYVHAFLGGIGKLFDTVASIAPGQLQSEIGFLVVTLTSLGVLHVANAPAFANAVSAVVLAVLALGVAIKGVVGAYATAKFTALYPTKPTTK